MIDATNPVVRNRVTTILWNMVQNEKAQAENHKVLATHKTISERDRAFEQFAAEVCKVTAAELERIHNAVCAGVVAEVIPPFTPGFDIDTMTGHKDVD